MWVFTLAVGAAHTPVNELDGKSTAILIALLILALIAAIVNGAYAIYMRRKTCTGPDVKKQAMRIWKEKKKELEEDVKDELEDEVKKTQTQKIKQKIEEDIKEQIAKRQAQQELEVIEELESRIDDELESIKKQLRQRQSNDA